MKNLISSISILLLLFFAVTCELPDTEPYTTQWILSGTAAMSGTPTYDVKLCAFYVGNKSFGSVVNPSPVSNVVNLGISGGPFTLNIDASNLSPRTGHYIDLIMLQDENGDDLYEDTEDWEYTMPQVGCPAFHDAWNCEYYFDEESNVFMGTDKSWNQAIGIAEYIPVNDAVKTGAKIQNEFPWW